MKKSFLLLTAVLFTISCTQDDDSPKNNNNTSNQSGETKEVYIDTTVGEKEASNTWHYVSAKDAKVIGTALNVNVDDEDPWAKRTDWDFAIQRAKVKTNSGSSTEVDAKGGLFTLTPEITFSEAGISHLGYTAPTTDPYVWSETMSGGTLIQSKSAAVVSIMEGMPPKWLKSPIYVIRSADGTKQYKVEFTSYQNAEQVLGHVTFNIAEIY